MRVVRLLVLLLPVVALPIQSAAAAGCAKVNVSGGINSVALAPSSVTIFTGGCVTYANSSSAPLAVRITVGASSQTAAPGASVTFTEKKAGTLTVTADQQPTGGSARGRVVVRARPTPTPTPTPSHAPSSPPATTPPRTPTPSPAPDTGPQVAPTGSVTAPAKTPTVAPSTPGSFIVGQTTPLPSPAPSVAVISGPLQPSTNRGVGLPAALAALLVVGSGGGLLRVLLAEPTGRR